MSHLSTTLGHSIKKLTNYLLVIAKAGFVRKSVLLGIFLILMAHLSQRRMSYGDEMLLKLSKTSWVILHLKTTWLMLQSVSTVTIKQKLDDMMKCGLETGGGIYRFISFNFSA